jgi:hypothetical protein
MEEIRRLKHGVHSAALPSHLATVVCAGTVQSAQYCPSCKPSRAGGRAAVRVAVTCSGGDWTLLCRA